MINKNYLLDSKQMANFVSDGFLRFDELVPNKLNKAAYNAMEDRTAQGGSAGAPFSQVWAQDSPMRRIFDMPEIQGIIHSMVGSDPLYDHQAIHIVNAGNHSGQIWHGDAIIDTRMHFDIQFFYFAHDTPREMGGTMILPGSHYRRICETDIARYQNFLGQLPSVCKAGTIMVVHHGMWHCAQPNLTDQTRYMFKLRLNPTVRQMRLWNTDDIDDSSIPSLLGKNHKWYGNDVRLEFVNRIKFWRFLTGNEHFDMGYWLSRLENMPENAAVA